MKVLLSTAYFAPIEYYYFLLNAEEVLIEKHENYPKQTYRNRCVIYGANGPLNLSIPVRHKSQDRTPISEKLISFNEDWQTLHWRSMESAYRSSPFFEYYEDEVKDALFDKGDSLFTYNEKLRDIVLELMNESVDVNYTEEYVANYTDDFLDLREVISPKSTSSQFQLKEYDQVFKEKLGFQPNLSILDLIFNLGPSATDHLKA